MLLLLLLLRAGLSSHFSSADATEDLDDPALIMFRVLLFLLTACASSICDSICENRTTLDCGGDPVLDCSPDLLLLPRKRKRVLLPSWLLLISHRSISSSSLPDGATLKSSSSSPACSMNMLLSPS